MTQYSKVAWRGALGKLASTWVVMMTNNATLAPQQHRRRRLCRPSRRSQVVKMWPSRSRAGVRTRTLNRILCLQGPQVSIQLPHSLCYSIPPPPSMTIWTFNSRMRWSQRSASLSSSFKSKCRSRGSFTHGIVHLLQHILPSRACLTFPRGLPFVLPLLIIQ